MSQPNSMQIFQTIGQMLSFVTFKIRAVCLVDF